MKNACRLALIVILACAAPARVLAQREPRAGCHAEWDRPTEALVHTPGDELFLGVVHPEAALFERPFDLQGAVREHRAYIQLLKDRGVVVHTVVDALMAGTVDAAGKPVRGAALDALRELARGFITVDATALPASEQAEQATYLTQTLARLHPRELVTIVLQHPTVKLRPSLVPNTRYSATYEMAPVMNLYFCRDQQITTAAGVVMGRMNSEQRRDETRILKFALGKRGIDPIYEVTGDGRLEGGDFLPAGDTAFLGQGLRTNAQGVGQLLRARVFGVPRVVIVKDPWQNQDQMHLDTYFNILGPKKAVLVEERMDLHDAEGHVTQPANPARRCKIDVYELRSGDYVRTVTDGDFQAFLENDMGFELIAVKEADQLKYGINFICVGPQEVLGIAGSSDAYHERLAAAGVHATWMDFSNLTGGYGAAHCCTQVLARKRTP